MNFCCCICLKPIADGEDTDSLDDGRDVHVQCSDRDEHAMSQALATINGYGWEEGEPGDPWGD